MTARTLTEGDTEILESVVRLAVQVNREGCTGVPADAIEYFTTYDFAEAVRRHFGMRNRQNWRWCESVLLRVPTVRNVGDQTWRHCKPWSFWRRSRRGC